MYSNFCPPGLLHHLFRHSDVISLCPYMGKNVNRRKNRAYNERNHYPKGKIMLKYMLTLLVLILTSIGLGWISAELIKKSGWLKPVTIDLSDEDYEMYKAALLPDTDE